MRRTDKLRPADEAWALFRTAPVVHLAGSSAEGVPILRPLHPVVLDGALYVHGARAGEKQALLNRPVVASAMELLADVPSYWTHPEKACPATTLYRSAMAHGRLEEVDDLAERAAALQGLMERFQPEGGYRPLSVAEPLYERALKSIQILRLRPERIEAKGFLGLRKSEDWQRRVMAGLWQRGALRAVAAMWDAGAARPWEDHAGARLVPVMGPAQLDGAVALLRDTYWNVGVQEAELRAAQTASPAWVGAIDPTSGAVLATARAISDRHKLAYVMDVAVHPEHRGRGLGGAVMRLLLDHPAVRGCRITSLHTRDAGPFYAGLGFDRYIAPAWRSAWRRSRQPA